MVSRPSHYNTRYKHDLTPKQVQVLELMATGKTNAEIGEALGVTLDGAKWHVSEILGKLGTDSREEAVAWWKAYRRPSAMLARRVTAAMAWGIWKPAAIGGSVLGVAGIAGLAFLAFRGGGEGAGGTAELPACHPENMHWGVSMEGVDGKARISLRISLRDPEWYEGIMRTLRLSDRRVESPCRLETAASVRVVELGPLPDDKGGTTRAPLDLVETEPAGPVEVPVLATLRRGEETTILTAEIGNWCLPPGSYALNVELEDMFREKTYHGLPVDLPAFPGCEDASRPPALTLTVPGPVP